MRTQPLVAFALTVLVSNQAEARNFRQGQVPNGPSYTCDSCHGKRSLLAEDLTPFGVDVNQTLSGDDVNWSAIWDRDSDGDGFSNGLELGDPGGTWRRGDPHPDAPTANPGIPNEGICGNGDAEPDEDCDTSDLRGESCQSLGFGEGTLTCHNLCRWDTRECGGCGDGYLNPAFEDCDRDAFPSDATCEDFGFLRGEVSCTSDCKIDPSTCTDEAPAVCGDGVISTGELCDGENLGQIDCVRIAYAGGELLCTDQCRWDASNCVLDDGRRVGDEERAAEDDGAPPPDGGDAGHDPGPSPGGPDVGEGLGGDAGTVVAADGKACSSVGQPPLANGRIAPLLVLFLFVARRRARR